MIPEYNTHVRYEVLKKITSDPIWYFQILIKRIDRIFSEVTPLNVAVGPKSISLISSGYPILFLLGFLIYLRKWELIKLIGFTFSLSLPALLIYSDRGMTYYAIYLQLSAAIILAYTFHLLLFWSKSIFSFQQTQTRKP